MHKHETRCHTTMPACSSKLVSQMWPTSLIHFLSCMLLSALCCTSLAAHKRCDDDPLFLHLSDTQKDCNWVGQDLNRCNLRTGLLMKHMCPSSCGICAHCADDPVWFRAGKEDCRWVRENASRCNLRDGPKLEFFCPSTCGVCVDIQDMFVDVSDKLAELASDSNAHPKLYSAYQHFQAPKILDINGDGYPDMFQHYHHYWTGVYGLSLSRIGSQVRYTAGKVTTHYQVHHDYPGLDRDSKCTSDMYLEEMTCVLKKDYHANLLVDLDRDGILDMFQAIGGGSGVGQGISFESMLYWGVDTTGVNSTKPVSNLQFVGGRQSSLEAGLLSGSTQRTYGLYAADFNNDGYLDIVYLNWQRKDDIEAHGHVYINQGPLDPRKFVVHKEVSAYARAALLTDWDQDGQANELLLLEFKLGASVYKWSERNENKRGGFVKIWTAPSSIPNLFYSAASGDWNGDGLSDVVILSGRKLIFFYSTAPGTHLGKSSEHISIAEDCSPSRSLRASDFDLDGTVDLLVVCAQGTHKIYTRSSGNWDEMSNLGALSNPEINTAPTNRFWSNCCGPGYFYECGRIINGTDDCCDKRSNCEKNSHKVLFTDIRFTVGKAMFLGATVFDYNNSRSYRELSFERRPPGYPQIGQVS